MDQIFLEHLCKYYALSTGSTVRLYDKEQRISTHSVFSLQPDPFCLYEKEILSDSHPAGIFSTELFQLYGFLHLEDYCIVIGPSCILTNDTAGIENLLFLLDVKEADREEYRRKLLCAPTVNVERLAFSLSFFSTAATRKPFYPEDVFIKTSPDFLKNPVREHNARQTLFTADDTDLRHRVEKSYSFEKIILFYIRTGHPELLLEIMSSMPNMIKAGEMAKDTLRQLKNMSICSATVASRAAIEGGLDSQTAFQLSDLYIQRFEMMKDAASIQSLTSEMFSDYASRIMQMKYPGGTGSHLFQECARYVSTNLFTVIKAEEMAKELGIARTYLCSQFHRITGITLSQFIMSEKINEAQRLLLFTDKSISDIAAHLAFSSQSHFQTAFKKTTGETPLEFRLSQT